MIKKSHIFVALAGSFLLSLSSLAANVSGMPDNLLSKTFLFSAANTDSSDVTPDEENKFTLFINQNTLSIKYNNPVELINGEVIIYNLLGQEITRKKLENSNLNQVSIPVQNTCYLVKISYSGKVHTQKVMVSAN